MGRERGTVGGWVSSGTGQRSPLRGLGDAARPKMPLMSVTRGGADGRTDVRAPSWPTTARGRRAGRIRHRGEGRGVSWRSVHTSPPLACTAMGMGHIDGGGVNGRGRIAKLQPRRRDTDNTTTFTPPPPLGRTPERHPVGAAAQASPQAGAAAQGSRPQGPGRGGGGGAPPCSRQERGRHRGGAGSGRSVD